MRVDPTALRDYLAPLPDGFPVTVPKEYILELLEVSGSEGVTAPPKGADLTVQEVATRFGRDPSTVRLWISQGRFSGAYRFQGREWRIPPAALAAFEEMERLRAPASVPRPQGGPDGQRSRVVGLSAWRRTS